jgi:hypothetical protein
MILSAANLQTLRTRPQQTRLYMSIFEPQIVFQARISDASIERGERVIEYDTVSLGNFNAIKAGATMWVGTTPGGNDIGKIRVRSATSSEITVSENSNIEWADNLYLTVFYYFELWPVFPRVIQNPSNDEDVIFYKDYDIPYTNQNSILGTFVNIGPHRAGYLDPASGQKQFYWTSTGTHNLLGNSLTYDWWFQGATVTGSSSATPGYITYNTPGHYVTRLTVTDAENGSQDTTYRYVSVYNQANPSVQKWQMASLNGSRDEGGYTATFKVFEDIPIQEHAVVVIFAENWYGTTQQSFGGNYPNGSDIFWVGYIDQDSISYDYQHSEVSFNAKSITGMMRDSSGFSVSVESKANPSKWYELLDMDCRRAIYHYLRWHTTALNIADFQFLGDDQKIQFFDSDRESMFDAVDNFMRMTLWGKSVSDRQGKVWIEIDADAHETPTADYPPIMNISNRDWMNAPTVEERLSEDLSFLEMGGVAYSGVVTGTFSALIGAAPGNAPGFHGALETHEGLALLGQSQLNAMVGNIFANRNSLYPRIDMEMAINMSNLDIAPQETVRVIIEADDTVRNVEIDDPYIPSSFDWAYSTQDFILLPHIEFRQLVDGDDGETIVVEVPEEVAGGFNVPPIQIPPLPPLTVPAYSIPSGTISAIVETQIAAFTTDYAFLYYNGLNTVSENRNIVIGSTTINKNLSSVQFALSKPGVYQVNGFVEVAFGDGIEGQIVYGSLGVSGITAYSISPTNIIDVFGAGKLGGTIAFVRLLSAGTLNLVWSLDSTGGATDGGIGLTGFHFSVARISS